MYSFRVLAQRASEGPQRASEGPWRILEGLAGALDRRMDGQTEILPCVLQDFVPFGSTALLQNTKNNRNTKEDKGIADHYWPRTVFYDCKKFFLGITLSITALFC